MDVDTIAPATASELELAGDPVAAPSGSTPDTASQPAIVAELLLEEISIDGMCGVY